MARGWVEGSEVWEGCMIEERGRGRCLVPCTHTCLVPHSIQMHRAMNVPEHALSFTSHNPTHCATIPNEWATLNHPPSLPPSPHPSHPHFVSGLYHDIG